MLKLKSFKFKFKTTNSGFFQFSLLLNLSSLLIRVKSQPVQISFVNKPTSLRSRLLKKFRIQPIKNKSFSARFTNCKQAKWDCFKGTFGVTVLIIANLALLFPLLFADDVKRVMILCFIIFVYVFGLSKRIVPTRVCILMILMNVAMVVVGMGWSSLLRTNNNFSYLSLLTYAWKAWNWTNSSSQSSYVPQELKDILLENLRRFTIT